MENDKEIKIEMIRKVSEAINEAVKDIADHDVKSAVATAGLSHFLGERLGEDPTLHLVIGALSVNERSAIGHMAHHIAAEMSARSEVKNEEPS